MAKKYLSIQESASLSKKSIQTIRRAIKSNKLKSKKQKTPQGFNYIVNRDSLFEVYNISEPKIKEETKVNKEVASKRFSAKSSQGKFVTVDDLHSFTQALDKMVSQHTEERQNFLRLINTLQEKIFVLENQLNLLKSPKKKWYHFWGE